MTVTNWQDAEAITELRRQMHRFASIQLGDPQQAEDAVQEALIGAMKNGEHFKGDAAFKTWVFAILKNKIADQLRQSARLVSAGLLHDEDEDLTILFNTQGRWHPDARPMDWGDPDEAFHQEDFWRVFDACLNNLPDQQARVFMMREFIELDTNEVCQAAGISQSNLFVILHRARLRLRECLENNWFSTANERAG